MGLKNILKKPLTLSKDIYFNIKRPSVESNDFSFLGINVDSFYFNKKEKTDIVNTIKNNKELFQEYSLIKKDFKSHFCIFGKSFQNSHSINWFYPLRKPLIYDYYKTISVPCNYDIKITWEINRLQHLPPLALIYILEGEENLKDIILSQIENWRQSNPYKLGINWVSSLEVGLRCISLLWLLFILGHEEFPEKILIQYLKLLQMHGNFIEENLSLQKKFPNNHLIGEAASLGILAISCPFFKDSSRWLQTADRILSKNLDNQFFEGGVHKEQAFAYHRFVTDFYIHYIILAKKTGLELDSRYVRKLNQMLDYICHSLMPDFNSPNTGDDDSGTLVKILGDSKLLYRNTLINGAILLKRKELLCNIREPSIESIFLFGIHEVSDIFEESSSDMYIKEENIASISFPSSGVYLMKEKTQDGDYYLNFDCGPQGWGEGGHGHADCLSFIVYAIGRPLIIDSGTYRYNGVYQWRSYFRGTAAHNTITVDNMDQSVPISSPDPFGWTFMPTPKLHHWITTQKFDFVDGEHNGYERLENPIIHRRKILFVKGEYWLISDILTGKGRHKFDSYFHFPPGKIFLNKDEGFIITLFEEANIKVSYLKDHTLSATIIEGSEDPVQGWVSYCYGNKLKSQILNLQKNTDAPTSFYCVLHPFKNKVPPHIRVEKIVDSKTLKGLKIEFSTYNDFFFYSDFRANHPIINYEDISTDAEVCFYRKKGGMLDCLFIVCGSYIKNKNGFFFRAKNKLQFVGFYHQNGDSIFEMPSEEGFETYIKSFKMKLTHQYS